MRSGMSNTKPLDPVLPSLPLTGAIVDSSGQHVHQIVMHALGKSRLRNLVRLLA